MFRVAAATSFQRDDYHGRPGFQGRGALQRYPPSGWKAMPFSARAQAPARAHHRSSLKGSFAEESKLEFDLLMQVRYEYLYSTRRHAG